MYLLLGASILSLVTALCVIPAYADVNSLEIDKTEFDFNDKFTLSGTITDPDRVTLLASMKGPSSEKLTRTTISDHGAPTFSFVPVDARDLFHRKGIYTITVFTEFQAPENGHSIKLQYSGSDIILLPDYTLELNRIGNKATNAMQHLSFTASVSDSKVRGEQFGLERAYPDGAKINPNTGKFSWTPDATQIGSYIFDIVVNAGPLEDRETIQVTVYPATEERQTLAKDGQDLDNAQPQIPAPFVNPDQSPQHYIDRYASDLAYKEWFDTNYPQYSSIYEAVGLEQPPQIPAPFVNPDQSPQHYIDRYTADPAYKEWFDTNYPQYSSIYEAVGLEQPPQIPAPFVNPDQSPQHYIDRYTADPAYKEWFDTNYPQYSSIYEAVGLDPQEFKQNRGYCGAGTKLVDGVCSIIPAPQKPWWQFW